MKDFSNKTVLITGGASGIGRSTALALAARGAKIVVADMHQERGAETVRDIKALGSEAIFHACDVADEAHILSLRDAAHAAFGPLHILMNNVGILPVGNFADVPFSTWERTFAVNLFSYVRCTQIFLPDLIAAGEAHIVNTASAAGLFAYDTKSITYAVSKAAVVALSEGLALSLRPHNIGVTCLCPGGVMTNIIEQLKPHGDPTGMGVYASKKMVMRTADEVAAMVVSAIETNRFLLHTDDSVQETLKKRAANPEEFLDYISNFLANPG